MGRHHDQVDAVVVREIDDAPGRIAAVRDAIDVEACQLLGQRAIEPRLKIVLPRGRVITSARIRDHPSWPARDRTPAAPR